jgi:hypothetical protein
LRKTINIPKSGVKNAVAGQSIIVRRELDLRELARSPNILDAVGYNPRQAVPIDFLKIAIAH